MITLGRNNFLNNNLIKFTALPQNDKNKPLAIMVDLFDRKKTPNDVVEVTDWQSTLGHGAYTSTVAKATCPKAEIRTFDITFNQDSDDYYITRINEICNVIDRAIEIKKANPERPVSMNFSFGINIASLEDAKNALSNKPLSENIDTLKDTFLNPKQRTEYNKLFNKMHEFLNLKNTNLYIAAGNSKDDLSLILLNGHKNAFGVHGTDSKGNILPFYAFHELAPKHGQALYNVYKTDGNPYIKVNDNKVDLPYGYECFMLKSENLRSKLFTILGEDLKGKPFSEVKHKLMPVTQLIKNAPKEFSELNNHQKKYLLSKKDAFIPVGWGIENLEGVHLQKYGLFFNVDDKGMVYWSPDGSKPEPGEKVIGEIDGTSFAAPNAMMNDFARLIASKDTISFSGSIKLKQKPKPLNLVG